jgi:hypothetical protein
MPHFMLRELLAQRLQPAGNESEHQDDLISILNFGLIPGGICRNLQAKDDLVNKRLSTTVLESVRLLLAASFDHHREDSGDGATIRLSDEDRVSTSKLLEAIASSVEREDVIAGGFFPHLIAQKTFK